MSGNIRRRPFRPSHRLTKPQLRKLTRLVDAALDRAFTHGYNNGVAADDVTDAPDYKRDEKTYRRARRRLFAYLTELASNATA